MKSVFNLVLVVAVIAAGLWVWTMLFPTPESVIRGRLMSVARLASFSPNEGNFARVASVERLGTYFAEHLEVRVDDPRLANHNFNSRAELQQAALAARAAVASLQARFVDIKVKLAPDQNSAVADLTLKAEIATEKDPIWQEMKITLQKTAGKWLINRIETIKTLNG